MSGVVSFRWPVSTTALQRVVGENGFFLLILAGERFYGAVHFLGKIRELKIQTPSIATHGARLDSTIKKTTIRALK